MTTETPLRTNRRHGPPTPVYEITDRLHCWYSYTGDHLVLETDDDTIILGGDAINALAAICNRYG